MNNLTGLSSGTTSPYEESIFSNLLKAYRDLYEAQKEEQLRRFGEDLRRWNYEMAASGMLGSGPWVEGKRRRVSDILSGLTQQQAQYGGDILSQMRRFREYETGLGLNLASTLANIYGTRGILSTISDLMKLGSLPRTIEESSIQAALNDLFYRLGIGARIGGGFGRQYETSEEVIRRTAPSGFLGGLQAFSIGLLDYLSRLGGF